MDRICYFRSVFTFLEYMRQYEDFDIDLLTRKENSTGIETLCYMKSIIRFG